MANTIHFEENEGIAVVYLNRPKAYNAFDLDMVQRLSETLIDLALDRDIAGVVISGKGNAFCAGGDLRWVNGYGNDLSKAFHELAARFHQAIIEIRRMPKPVVAAINGLAAGGGFSMALSSDFRVMAASATLKQGYTSNGLSIDGGGSFMLPRLVGAAKALEIAAFDQPINAEKALKWGLVTENVNDGQAVETAVKLINKLKKRSLTSFAASKKLITDSFNTSFETHLENERNLLSYVAAQPNGEEGLTAFLEKRPPVFEAPSGKDLSTDFR
jgi:2-(1,2-epoxy-1,2-dihydrophenyl)acetyl-CoA isomerase